MRRLAESPRNWPDLVDMSSKIKVDVVVRFDAVFISVDEKIAVLKPT